MAHARTRPPSRWSYARRKASVRRSVLACPASAPDMMTKAAAGEADQVVFDLEDGCALSQKLPARNERLENDIADGRTLVQHAS